MSVLGLFSIIAALEPPFQPPASPDRGECRDERDHPQIDERRAIHLNVLLFKPLDRDLTAKMQINTDQKIGAQNQNVHGGLRVPNAERREQGASDPGDRQGIQEGRRQTARFVVSFLFDRHAKHCTPKEAQSSCLFTFCTGPAP